MKLSIVASMYKSAPYLKEFCERCCKAAEGAAVDDYEFILVNDDSPDDSLEVALALRKEDARIKVIDLSRNYGHHKAMMTGLKYAIGQRVFLLDCDLEEPPEVLSDWMLRMDDDPGLDVVYGVQKSRKGDWIERLSGWIFYRLVNMMSSRKLTVNMIVARLMSARYVKALVEHCDQEMYIFGLMELAGFRQQPLSVVKSCKGTTTYTFGRRLALMLNAVTNFSNKPLYMIFYWGVTISAFAFMYVIYLVSKWFYYSGKIVLGWTTLAVSIWAVGGFILTALGIIGIYLAKIFSETKPRPFTVIRHYYD